MLLDDAISQHAETAAELGLGGQAVHRFSGSDHYVGHYGRTGRAASHDAAPTDDPLQLALKERLSVTADEQLGQFVLIASREPNGVGLAYRSTKLRAVGVGRVGRCDETDVGQAAAALHVDPFEKIVANFGQHALGGPSGGRAKALRSRRTVNQLGMRHAGETRKDVDQIEVLSAAVQHDHAGPGTGERLRKSERILARRIDAGAGIDPCSRRRRLRRRCNETHRSVGLR